MYDIFFLTQFEKEIWLIFFFLKMNPNFRIFLNDLHLDKVLEFRIRSRVGDYLKKLLDNKIIKTASITDKVFFGGLTYINKVILDGKEFVIKT